MIRKHLIKTLRVVRTKIGAWYRFDLVWQDVTNPPKPVDVVPFDPSVALAGRDREKNLYSRTDCPPGIDGLPIVKKVPADMVDIGKLPDHMIDRGNSCIVQREDADVCLYIDQPERGKPEFKLACKKEDIPIQLRETVGKEFIYDAHIPEEEVILWIQNKPHIHMLWPRNVLCAAEDSVSRQEWEEIGRRILTTRKLDRYTIQQTAQLVKPDPSNEKACLQVPVATVEGAAELGLEIVKPTETDGASIYTNDLIVTDTAKAARVFPVLARMPKVRRIKYDYVGECYPLSERNVAILEAAYKETTITLNNGCIRLSSKLEEFDLAKFKGFLLSQTYEQPKAHTTGEEANRLFLPEKEAKNLYQIPSTLQRYWVEALNSSYDISYLLEDLAQCPLRNRKQEKKESGIRKAQLLKHYPKLPSRWWTATDEDVRKWQDLQKEVESGAVINMVEAPVFRESLSDPPGLAFQIQTWLLNNDPAARQDPIEKGVYCPGYRTLDELSQLPNYSELIKILFPSPLALSLIESKSAQAVLVADALT